MVLKDGECCDCLAFLLWSFTSVAAVNVADTCNTIVLLFEGLLEFQQK